MEVTLAYILLFFAMYVISIIHIYYMNRLFKQIANWGRMEVEGNKILKAEELFIDITD